LKVFPSWGYNFSFAGFWNKLFDPVGEAKVVVPLWPSPAVARYGTLISDVVVTAIVVAVALRARTPAGRDLAFGTAITAMLLVSPITWDISMAFLPVPSAFGRLAAEKPRWTPIVLVLILMILCLPQKALTELALGSPFVHAASPAFMLGAPSLKFYALLGVFILGLAAFQAEERSEPADQ